MGISAEDRDRSSEDRTLKNLSPNIEGLLCYVGGWVTGVIFLVLEQKNRFVRFHALQSIIVFGTLNLAGFIFGSLPVMGPGFRWLILLIGFILWIILMVKAASGEIFKLPWSGDLAEKWANETGGQPAVPLQQQEKNEAAGSEAAPPAARYSKADYFRAKYYSAGAQTGRTIGSAFAIAWSVALLIFFNFYNQYIAYYQPVYSGGVTHWQMYTLITPEFNSWLPVLTVTLVLSIIGHAILITYDKYLLRQIVSVILDAFAVATVVTLLVLFPFDFSPIPSTGAGTGVTIGLTITLVLLAVGFGIGALIEFIKLIVHLAEGKY